MQKETKIKKQRKPLTIPPVKTDINIDVVIVNLMRSPFKEYHISEETIFYLCSKMKEVTMEQSVLLQITTPITIVGDIHGQFTDLLRILSSTSVTFRQYVTS